MVHSTVYFRNCRAAFQGGGCRAAAFVGAYAESMSRGVSFSSLVGTSAGSIVAALIAAGATPKVLEQIIGRLDFREFLRPPERAGKSSLTGLVLRLFSNKANILDYLGIYSSAYIREFMDDELRRLLPHLRARVQFKDLVKPCAVVAADLSTRAVKIWSSALTPTDEVSTAVRASCSIPLFFQPVAARYVDGGVLSNLPSFVFNSDEDQDVDERILAFCLQADDRGEQDVSGLKSFVTALADTLIDGAQDLQLRLQAEVHPITISTGDIKATDFDRIDKKAISTLMESGIRAAASFFDEETLRVRRRARRSDTCRTYMQSYDVIARTVEMPIAEVVVCETTTDWVYKLFPTVMHWRRTGATVTVLLQNNADDPEHGPFRQRLLIALGCEVKVVAEIPYRGFVFNAQRDTALALVRSQRTKEAKAYDGNVYAERADSPVIAMLRDRAVGSGQPGPHPLPRIEKAEPEDVRILLKRHVAQYAPDSVAIHFKKVAVRDLMTITKYVTGFKYTQVGTLFEAYRASGLRLFEPGRILMGNGKSTLITPPVVEVHGQKQLVIEGTTRITYSHRNGIDELWVFLVEGVSAAMPSSKQFGLDEMLISDLELEGSSRYDGFDRRLFRSIERAVRDPATTLL